MHFSFKAGDKFLRAIVSYSEKESPPGDVVESKLVWTADRVRRISARPSTGVNTLALVYRSKSHFQLLNVSSTSMPSRRRRASRMRARYRQHQLRVQPADMTGRASSDTAVTERCRRVCGVRAKSEKNLPHDIAEIVARIWKARTMWYMYVSSFRSSACTPPSAFSARDSHLLYPSIPPTSTLPPATSRSRGPSLSLPASRRLIPPEFAPSRTNRTDTASACSRDAFTAGRTLSEHRCLGKARGHIKAAIAMYYISGAHHIQAPCAPSPAYPSMPRILPTATLRTRYPRATRLMRLWGDPASARRCDDPGPDPGPALADPGVHVCGAIVAPSCAGSPSSAHYAYASGVRSAFVARAAPSQPATRPRRSRCPSQRAAFKCTKTARTASLVPAAAKFHQALSAGIADARVRPLPRLHVYVMSVPRDVALIRVRALVRGLCLFIRPCVLRSCSCRTAGAPPSCSGAWKARSDVALIRLRALVRAHARRPRRARSLFSFAPAPHYSSERPRSRRPCARAPGRRRALISSGSGSVRERKQKENGGKKKENGERPADGMEGRWYEVVWGRNEEGNLKSGGGLSIFRPFYNVARDQHIKCLKPNQTRSPRECASQRVRNRGKCDYVGRSERHDLNLCMNGSRAESFEPHSFPVLLYSAHKKRDDSWHSGSAGIISVKPPSLRRGIFTSATLTAHIAREVPILNIFSPLVTAARVLPVQRRLMLHAPNHSSLASRGIPPAIPVLCFTLVTPFGLINSRKKMCRYGSSGPRDSPCHDQRRSPPSHLRSLFCIRSSASDERKSRLLPQTQPRRWDDATEAHARREETEIKARWRPRTGEIAVRLKKLAGCCTVTKEKETPLTIRTVNDNKKANQCGLLYRAGNLATLGVLAQFRYSTGTFPGLWALGDRRASFEEIEHTWDNFGGILSAQRIYFCWISRKGNVGVPGHRKKPIAAGQWGRAPLTIICLYCTLDLTKLLSLRARRGPRKIRLRKLGSRKWECAREHGVTACSAGPRQKNQSRHRNRSSDLEGADDVVHVCACLSFVCLHPAFSARDSHLLYPSIPLYLHAPARHVSIPRPLPPPSCISETDFIPNPLRAGQTGSTPRVPAASTLSSRAWLPYRGTDVIRASILWQGARAHQGCYVSGAFTFKPPAPRSSVPRAPSPAYPRSHDTAPRRLIAGPCARYPCAARLIRLWGPVDAPAPNARDDPALAHPGVHAAAPSQLLPAREDRRRRNMLMLPASGPRALPAALDGNIALPQRGATRQRAAFKCTKTARTASLARSPTAAKPKRDVALIRLRVLVRAHASVASSFALVRRRIAGARDCGSATAESLGRLEGERVDRLGALGAHTEEGE
ncbi:hypothetical protein C8R44DRAFT_917450 [Mycena epipterygia]|nr:hypothetical protein C8R44DRAFT_917450 [Mycena epipterygia]